MKSNLVWMDKVHDVNKIEQNIYDLSFNPDGSQLLVAAGQAILVYNCSDGTMLQSLNGHKDTVYCVDYCRDGKKFASGGADKVVIIWTSKLEAVLKYTHNDGIQSVRFNNVTYTLVTCAITDFSFWSSEQKSVQKYKISSKINASCWNTDGQYLALGLANGTVSIRNGFGDERCLIERAGGSDSPIWSLAFSPLQAENDVLCVTDWSHRLSFYNINGKKIGKERTLGFEALSVSYSHKGDYILVSGCNNQCILLSREGIYLGSVNEKQKSWIWSCAWHPTASFVVNSSFD